MVTDATPAAAAQADNPKAEGAASALVVQQQNALVNMGDTARASWRFSLDALRANIAYMAPEAKELLIWAFLWCTDKDHPMHFEKFADAVGYSENVLYKLYHAKYKHPETGKLMDAPEKLLKNLRSFRRLEVSRAKMGRHLFVMTPTAKRIYWAIEQARKSGRPVMIYGGSQMGKTEAFKHNAIEFNHGKTVLVEIEAVNGLRGLLQAIAVKVGISPNANTPDLIERLKKALKRDMVLILDEVHLLANVYRKGSFFACMEQIRRLWDACRFGLVFSYTELGYAKAEKERKRELMQIFRRGPLRVNLGNEPTVGDVRAIMESYGLDWGARHETIDIAKGVSDTPFAALRQLAAEDGLTVIIERVRLAHELAADADRQEITWHDFLTAHFAVAKQNVAPDSGWGKESAA